MTIFPKPILILDTPVHDVTMSQVLSLAMEFMNEPRLHQIATVNPEFIMTAQGDTTFREVLEQADLCIPDGIGLLLAARWLGYPLSERVAGSDLVYELAGLAGENGWPLFLLGAAEGVAAEAGNLLQSRYPGLQIAGCYAGSPAISENEGIIARINDSQAEILYVAYGAPNQDKWIARNKRALSTVRLAMGVGGALDFITGRSARAPVWAQRLGLEWLHRLYKEPWRWRRMLALPRFAWQVARQPRHPREDAPPPGSRVKE